MANRRRPAQHRKPKPRTVSRGAATLCTAAATMTGVMTFGGVAHAEPAPSISEVKEQVNSLHRDAIKATEVYNGVQEKFDELQKSANATQARVVEEQAALQELRDQVGAIAASQYRNGALPAELRLALSADPLEFLQQAQMMEQLDSQQASRLRQLSAQTRMLQQDRTEASNQLAELDKLRKELSTKKTEIQEKLNKAQELLNRLTEEQRQAILRANEHQEQQEREAQERASRDDARGDTSDEPTVDVPASGRAATAVQFAMNQRGKPYGWGSEGPSSYDCSGLTQAAWNAAGVDISRTTWTQVNDGTRVSKSQLQPGDLVFFYPDNTHVGMYIGNGKMVHAPRPGTSVRVESISVMPFYAAVRIA